MMEPLETCLNYKTKKSEGDCEVLETGVVPTKGTPTVKLARCMRRKIKEVAIGCMEHQRNKSKHYHDWECRVR